MEDVKMAYQVPVPLLNVWKGDFDFALAHLINFDTAYKSYYQDSVGQGRLVLLDNSIHELGYPLTIEEIANADNAMGGATFIIPPDWHNDKEKTIDAVEVAVERFGVHRLAPVVQGNNTSELQACYDWYCQMGCRMICLPYRREDRFDIVPKEFIRHHFLSFHTVEEISYMRSFPSPTCDTGKPFRFAQHSTRLPVFAKHKQELPKLDMFSQSINEQTLETNLDWIEKACKGDLGDERLDHT